MEFHSHLWKWNPRTFYGRAAAEESFSDCLTRTFTSGPKTIIGIKIGLCTCTGSLRRDDRRYAAVTPTRGLPPKRVARWGTLLGGEGCPGDVALPFLRYEI